MTWFMAGAATLTVATTYIGAQSSKNSAIKSANSASKAEGEAIVAERQARTVQNAYDTAFQQMRLGLQKKQLSQASADTTAAALAAHGDVDTAIAATGSIGASVQAISADITQKADAANQQIADEFENAVENYNNALQATVLNTDRTKPQVRPVEYNGPSNGAILGMSLLQGLGTFASAYAARRMSLGPGTTPSSYDYRGTTLPNSLRGGM